MLWCATVYFQYTAKNSIKICLLTVVIDFSDFLKRTQRLHVPSDVNVLQNAVEHWLGSQIPLSNVESSKVVILRLSQRNGTVTELSLMSPRVNGCNIIFH